MCLAVALFSCLDTTAKVLTTRMGLPVSAVAWARFLVQFIALIVIIPALGVMSVRDMFRSSQVAWQLVRSVLMAATTVFNFLALQTLRLDQTITIVFLAPLVVALLAGPLLGEWVGWRRMVAILTGFAGILIAVHPSSEGINFAVVYSLLAMLAYALFMLLTRHIGGRDPPLVTLFYSMFVGTFFGAPIAIEEWVWPPDAATWAMLISLGVFGGLGHYVFLHAYRLAPASSVAPFLYTQILSMVALGYLVFGDVPDAWTITGAAIVAASGIYLIHRERVVRLAQRAAKAAR
jgi:drug/metabolite transporter (DMT)-like permease